MKPALRLTGIALALAAFNVSATVMQAQFNYTTNDGAITITGYTGSGGDVIIPAAIDSLPVTSIGNFALSGCTNLVTVSIPGSVTNIGNSAFSYCGSLTNIAMGNGLISIGTWAFSECTNLTVVTIPGSVTWVGMAAFSGCSRLEAIAVDVLNPDYSSVDGVLFNETARTLVECPAGKAGSYAVPTGVVSIGHWAFSKCTSLTNVHIPESVVGIGVSAFYGCNLSDIVIPSHVAHIGEKAFSGCRSLVTITVDALNPHYRSVNGVLFDKSMNALLGCPGGKEGSYTVPEGVQNIGNWAFSECTALTSVMIPGSVTRIGDGAFYWCTGLTNVAIPESVTHIGGWTFYVCQRLPNVRLPQGITNIGDNTFSFCTGLTNITVPQSVSSLGKMVFYSCSGLTGVFFQGNAPSMGVAALDAADQATVFYLPGTTGWGPAWGGRPTALWVLPQPVILTTGAGFGAQPNGFGFRISWATNASVVVEASTRLSVPDWSPVSTNTLTDGWVDFSSADWTHHPARFYRVRSP